jgi:hypothetical protein
MASLRIDSGQLPTARGRTDRELMEVVRQWQSIAHGRFPDDCSKLLQIIEETDELRLWEKNIGGFTFKSRNEFLQQKVLINFDLTEANVVKIVESLKRGDVASAQDVFSYARANPLQSADQEEAPRNPNGINQHKKEERSVDNVNRPKGGNDTTYTLRRLARDNPELLDKIEAGELTVNQAAIQAGIRKKPTAEEQCVKAFRKSQSRLVPLKVILEALDPHELVVVMDWIKERLDEEN